MVNHNLSEECYKYNGYKYNGYSGNYETYLTFKELLKIYLEGINLYNYKGKYYTYDQLKTKYDIYSLEHQKFINEHLLDYTNDFNKSIEDLIKYHPEVIKISCKCIDVQDPSDSLRNPLAKLKLKFRAKSIFGENNKKYIIKPTDTIIMYLRLTADFIVN